jgi:dTDP-4-amino-4,6-dideoxygalactose transaminase
LFAKSMEATMLDKPELPALPIVRPTFPPLASIAKRFSESLASGFVTNDGPYVREFEAALTEYLGVPTIAFSSGMAALIAMLMVEDVAGCEVICPSFTFCATPNAIRLAGGKVVFADIDPDTLTLAPADVARKITTRTKAILGVDVYGICCNHEGLQRIADIMNYALLFDSAPAFGSLVNGAPTGRYGRAQIFSFHATKPFTTMEGGCLCSNDEGFISRAKKIRNFGQPSSLVGFNGKMMEVCALIGLEQLKDFKYMKSPVRFSAQWTMQARLSDISGVRLVKIPEDHCPIWTYYPILIDEAKFGMSRDAVVEVLARRGIMVRIYYPAMHLDEAYRDERVSLPVTERVASQVIALPIYNDQTASECERIAGALRGRLDG